MCNIKLKGILGCEQIFDLVVRIYVGNGIISFTERETRSWSIYIEVDFQQRFNGKRSQSFGYFCIIYYAHSINRYASMLILYDRPKSIYAYQICSLTCKLNKNVQLGDESEGNFIITSALRHKSSFQLIIIIISCVSEGVDFRLMFIGKLAMICHTFWQNYIYSRSGVILLSI